VVGTSTLQPCPCDHLVDVPSTARHEGVVVRETCQPHRGMRADVQTALNNMVAEHCHVVVEDIKFNACATNGCRVYSFMVRSASRHTSALVSTSTILPLWLASLRSATWLRRMQCDGRGVVVWTAATMSLKASYPPRMQRSCADGMIVSSRCKVFTEALILASR